MKDFQCEPVPTPSIMKNMAAINMASKDSHLSDELLDNLFVQLLAKRLAISPIQAVLLSFIAEKSVYGCCDLDDMARHFRCQAIIVMEHCGSRGLDGLCNKGILYRVKGKNLHFRVVPMAMAYYAQNIVYYDLVGENPMYGVLLSKAFVDAEYELIQKRIAGTISFDEYVDRSEDLLRSYSQVPVVRNLLQAHDEDWTERAILFAYYMSALLADETIVEEDNLIKLISDTITQESVDKVEGILAANNISGFLQEGDNGLELDDVRYELLSQCFNIFEKQTTNKTYLN